MAYFICEKQGRCCPHEFYDSIEQAITDSEDGVPCDHLIEVAPVRHGRWKYYRKQGIAVCTQCSFERKLDDDFGRAVSCPNCGAKMDADS